ncbi:MAG: hypothetical protein AAGG56_07410 [Pseudomonadota bacterium]
MNMRREVFAKMGRMLWVAGPGCLLFVLAACTDVDTPPQTVAEREEVIDEFLTTGPLVSGDIPSADQGAPFP